MLQLEVDDSTVFLPEHAHGHSLDKDCERSATTLSQV